MPVIKAPFTPKQVEALNLYQKSGFMHPFTCGSGNRKDDKHLDGDGVLEATPDGWICPYCDYTQDWARSFMTDMVAFDAFNLPFNKGFSYGKKE